MNLKNDIKATFNQVTDLNTDSRKKLSLKNASFKRLPNPDALRYWIDNFGSDKDNERALDLSFIASDEFQENYGDNISISTYFITLYKNFF